MIWGDVITNATTSSTRRVDMVFGIGYADDISKAEQILGAIVTGHSKNVASRPVVSPTSPCLQNHTRRFRRVTTEPIVDQACARYHDRRE